MKRRRLVFGTAVLGLLPALAGCEWNHGALRPKSGDHDPDVTKTSASKDGEGKKDEDDSETDKVLDVRSNGSKSQPFFKATRLSGAMSDEGRDIEKDLGIN